METCLMRFYLWRVLNLFLCTLKVRRKILCLTQSHTGGGVDSNPPVGNRELHPDWGLWWSKLFLVFAKFATFGKKKTEKNSGSPPQAPLKKGAPEKWPHVTALMSPYFPPEIVRFILGGMFAKTIPQNIDIWPNDRKYVIEEECAN